jgi:thymidylate synthase ThyX
MNNPIWTPQSNGVDIVTLAALEREFNVRLSPEDSAMLAALFSRDSRHPRVHVAEIAAEMNRTWRRRNLNRAIRWLEKISGQARSRAARFMERYYSGYAHKSIADCGSTTIFFVGVSVLAAKALEDSPMFSGQEPSTRYIPFGTSPVWLGADHPRARELIARLMDFYQRAEEPVLAHVKQKFPLREGEKEKDWEGAVRARGFDIRRAFLPAGVATNVAWHGNLRQLADHLIMLRHHPLAEVRAHAVAAWAALRADYPSSFPEDAAMLDVSGERAKGRIEALEGYRGLAAKWMWSDLSPRRGTFSESFRIAEDSIVLPDLSDLAHELLANRPRGAGLPAGFGEFGTVTFEASVDFGSYRDLHRQRRGYWRMPVLTPYLGFEPWYIEQLPEELRDEARELSGFAELAWGVVDGAVGEAEAQYMLPMGFRVAWRYTCGLPQVLYICELRTAKTVHPTARYVAQEMARYVQARWPRMALHVDLEEDDWNVRRGSQTIVKRPVTTS